MQADLSTLVKSCQTEIKRIGKKLAIKYISMLYILCIFRVAPSEGPLTCPSIMVVDVISILPNVGCRQLLGHQTGRGKDRPI